MNSKLDKIKLFNPNSVASNLDNMYGLPFTKEECEMVLIPVPWEVTVSYSGGTSLGPELIQKASLQVDLFDPTIKNAWQLGIYMDNLNETIIDLNETYRPIAEVIIDRLGNGDAIEDIIEIHDVNEACVKMIDLVKQQALQLIQHKKIIGLIGGDHSTPLGLLQALSNQYQSFGILQIDAHADLRKSYEGFTYSHASIMYNALLIPQVSKLVQVGIRDYCEDEFNIIQNSNGRIQTFFDKDIKSKQYQGVTWHQICQQIIEALPQMVYLSFDIDGLDQKLCPGTGTPVAGGFESDQILYLLELIVNSGKKIIAYDLNEVSGDNEWNANVAARLLYKISNLVMKSQGKTVD